GSLARALRPLGLAKPARSNGAKDREDALSKQQLRHGYELLRRAQARILGVVLNKYETEGRNDYYGYYGYYGNYGGYDNYGGYGYLKPHTPSESNGNGHSGSGGTEPEALASAPKANPKAA